MSNDNRNCKRYAHPAKAIQRLSAYWRTGLEVKLRRWRAEFALSPAPCVVCCCYWCCNHCVCYCCCSLLLSAAALSLLLVFKIRFGFNIPLVFKMIVSTLLVFRVRAVWNYYGLRY